MISNSIKVTGKVDISIIRDNKVINNKVINNLVVNTGLDFITSRLTSDSATVMSHMGIGTGTTAVTATDTDLETIAGSREAIDTIDTSTTGVLVYSCIFEGSDNSGNITEAALFNASTAGTMLSRTVFSPLIKTSEDTMKIIWTLTFTPS